MELSLLRTFYTLLDGESKRLASTLPCRRLVPSSLYSTRNFAPLHRNEAPGHLDTPSTRIGIAVRWWIWKDHRRGCLRLADLSHTPSGRLDRGVHRRSERMASQNDHRNWTRALGRGTPKNGRLFFLRRWRGLVTGALPPGLLRDVETCNSTHHNATALPRLLLLVCERQSEEEWSAVAWLLHCLSLCFPCSLCRLPMTTQDRPMTTLDRVSGAGA